MNGIKAVHHQTDYFLSTFEGRVRPEKRLHEGKSGITANYVLLF